MAARIRSAAAAEMDTIRALFREYERWLGISLCFQGFEQELADLPGKYAEPQGALLVAEVDGTVVGCVALRPLPEGICEMKRLFVRSPFLGQGLGRKLAEAVLAAAVAKGYRRIRLDTMKRMEAALALYRKLGFVEVAPYTHNPEPDVVYLEKQLA